MQCSLVQTAVLFLAAMYAVNAQPGQPPLTKGQLTYFDYVLMTISNPDVTPDVAALNEKGFIVQLGLNPDEALQFVTIRNELRSTLRQLKQSHSLIVANKSQPLASMETALAGLKAQRLQTVEALTTRFLASIRPDTGSRLRVHATLHNDVWQRNWRKIN